jgi:hypothetical protein
VRHSRREHHAEGLFVDGGDGRIYLVSPFAAVGTNPAGKSMETWLKK